MSDHTKIISLIPIQESPNANFYKVTVFYSKGGYNYFNSTKDERGYYLSVRAVSRSQRNGYVTESYPLFSGVKKLLQVADRFSRKVFEGLAQANHDQLVADFIKHLETRNPQQATQS